MTTYWTKERTDLLGTLDASGANTLDWVPGVPIDAKRVIFITTIAQTTADATITIGKRDAMTGSNSVTHGTVVLPFTGSAIGEVQEVFLGKVRTTAVASTNPSQFGDTVSVVYDADPGLLQTELDQELFFTSDGGGDAGTYAIYVEYQVQGGTGSRWVTVTELTFTPA